MKYVYSFAEGGQDMRSLLGGKGANLAEMTAIGLQVPPGFTVTTEVCSRCSGADSGFWPELVDEIVTHIRAVEEQLGKGFGSAEAPLLFSVRSGAVVSMPGMMDTILNLGLNDKTVEGLARLTGNPRFAYDSYRRFIQMFGEVAMGIPRVRFDRLLESVKETQGYELDTQVTAEEWKELVMAYQQVYRAELEEDFPQDVMVQLLTAAKAVFASWHNPRAVVYRNHNGIDHNLGTAVNIQAMVFGNRGETSGTGVAFTRNPATGEAKLYGEFLLNAQGEDVVAGIRTPQPIDQLQAVMPEAYEEFVRTAQLLEHHYRDMQDIEFTIEEGRLFLLQTRAGKRTAQAAVQVAVDLVEEGILTPAEAVGRVEPGQLEQLLHPAFDPVALAGAPLLATGLPASPGAGVGHIYFHADDVMKAKLEGVPVILVRQETSPEDIEGMISAQGILTARGGMTSHAAVVARGMGRCCVAGCHEIRVDEVAKTLTVAGRILREGDVIALDGNQGKVYLGDIPRKRPELGGSYQTFMGYVDSVRRLGVRTNADTPQDAQVALDFGAEGIGLCRTEHMFFERSRIRKVRQMILAQSVGQRMEALTQLLPLQRADFEGIYEVMGARPVTIRLLDPPLHEFLPQEPQEVDELAGCLGIAPAHCRDMVEQLHEVNPMLGHRGCRLAVTYPEIYEMQTRAIMEAALAVKRRGIVVAPEIMIPLVGTVAELSYVKTRVEAVIAQVFGEMDDQVDYTIGTMIEVPRAALTADEIAQKAAFFSFGTNDLTQMGFGFSRDDAGKFLGSYTDRGILPCSPFGSLDTRGIGKLVSMAVTAGRQVRPHMKMGVCGEHGGDPASIAFFHQVGLDYVSCSPYRVPIARLAAAQAALL